MLYTSMDPWPHSSLCERDLKGERRERERERERGGGGGGVYLILRVEPSARS